MDIYLLRNVQLSPEIKVSRWESIFLFVTVARRGDGDIPGLGGGLAPALSPAVRLRVGAPGLHQLGQGHHWQHRPHVCSLIYLLFYTYKNLYNNIVKNVFLLPSFTYSILIGDQQINRGWLEVKDDTQF